MLLREGFVEFRSTTNGRVVFHKSCVLCVYQEGDETARPDDDRPPTTIALKGGFQYLVPLGYEEVCRKIQWTKQARSAAEAAQCVSS